MTLILSVATSEYVIQVGDRRVTQRETPGAPARIFDPQSNKQVVFLCDDAVAVVGYSGAAFLDELPTDHVIAEALADRQMRYRNGRLGISIAPRPSDTTIDGALRRLRSGLQAGLASERRRVADRPRNLDVTIAGWVASDHVKPFVANYTNKAAAGDTSAVDGDFEVVIGRPDEQAFAVAVTPDNRAAMQRLERLPERLRARRVTPSIARDWLRGVIREIALSGSTVGRDTMAIVLPRPDNDDVRAELTYTPDGEAPTVGLMRADGTVVHQARGTFTPWIVANGVAQSPMAVLMSQGEMTIGGLRVVIAAPSLPPDAPTDFAGGSMPERLRSGIRVSADDD